MAIFHLNARIVSRAKGQSAVAKAAYNAHDLLTNQNTGDRHDYRYKGEVVFSGIFVPKNAPDWVQELAQDRQALWSAVEQRETRKNSQLAREIEIALPHELTDKQREYLVKDFVRENFVRPGMIADVAIHAPSPEGDKRNHHAHILLTMRYITPDGFGEKMRELNGREQLKEWREKWEHIANRYLEKFGHEARIDSRSLEAQGIDREPTSHVGPTATDFEREGVKTARGDINREVQERNREREQLTAAEKKLSAAIDQVQLQLDKETKEQQAALDRRAQEMRERNAATAEAIRNTWAEASGDAIGFMIGLNERGLYVALDERGYYAAVEKSGFTHRLPMHMHGALDDLRRENTGLIIPTVEEQRAEQQQQREQEKEAREREEERRASYLGATLYDRADMVSMQRDAMRHLKDAHRLREQQEERERTEDTPRDPREQAREEGQARTEMTDARREQADKSAASEQTDRKQRQAGKQSAMERAFNFRASDEARARSGDYEHERERE